MEAELLAEAPDASGAEENAVPGPKLGGFHAVRALPGRGFARAGIRVVSPFGVDVEGPPPG